MSTATTVCPRLHKSIRASANPVSSMVENATTTAPGGTAARGAKLLVLLWYSLPTPSATSSTR